MKIIPAKKIRDAVEELCIRANINLRKDVLKALKAAYRKEKNNRARKITGAILANARVAAEERLAICQDTGLPIVFVEIGQDVRITGDLKAAINKGVELGYKKAYLRNSIVKNPLLRGTSGYAPAVIHIDIARGNKLKLSVLPKGFGCENKSQLKMFKPTTPVKEIKEFIIGAVKNAGADACPPYVVGVGIGGSADYAVLMAKRALLRDIGVGNRQSYVRTMEMDLLKKINRLNIGPMGLGGKITTLGVNIEIYPTHIAGMPVAVNISCHAMRSATKVI
ncbi:MAG: fumarate hydratase [Deltaproteobacteria bacterium]